MTQLIICHHSAFPKIGHSNFNDPFGLFVSCQSQSQIYSMLGLYCFPDAFVRVGWRDKNQSKLCDGPLSRVWFHDWIRKEIAIYHVIAPSLMVYAGGVDGKPDLFMAFLSFYEWDDMPLICKFTRQSPDLPSWLSTIDDAVNSKRSNVTPIFERSQVSYWVKKQLPRYTWYLHELIKSSD